ncbi:hypothetical protein HPB52_014057 [Rhipicephalus sanguineus]|uniref:Uncharacterized protein n=1 Tax=Rhipicephalus sanguineus TaxID=34632 RepID=A0A9D4PJP4_RHISA|nr:hypothetical protein HPB52_014057 [Rhipicephalus sanguineus]
MKRETTINLYMAIEMLQAAWMSVTASMIVNCFRHASFGVNSSGDSEDIRMRVPRVTKTWRRGMLSLTLELCPTATPSARSTSVPMLTR